MKKGFFILFVSILCLQLPGLAQKSRVGFTAGFSISNMTDTLRVSNKTGSSLKGFTVGIVVDVPMGKSAFSFHPGLHFMQKGKELEKTATRKSSIALRYADVDLNFVYNTKGPKVNFFIGAGPSVGLPLPSKKVTKIGEIKSEDNITFGNTGVESFNGIDYGVNFIGGLNLTRGFYAAANYTMGLRNIVSDETSKNKIRNSCFALRFGYLFNNK